MTAITIKLPDALARYVAEQNLNNPSWIETALRGAISMNTPEKKPARHATEEEKAANKWLFGCCVGLVKPGGVERFLAERRADKERELAIERRQENESKRYAAH